MHLNTKLFNDTTSGLAIQKIRANKHSTYSEIVIYFTPDDKERIIAALRHAGIPLSYNIVALFVKSNGLSRTPIRAAFEALKSEGLISESFVRHISDNFPGSAGQITPLSETETEYEDVLIGPHSATLLFFDVHRIKLHSYKENAEKLTEINFPDKEIPQEYICPLSLMIMDDPVYLQDDITGQRFERSWISKWLSEHEEHPTSRMVFPLSAIQSDVDLKSKIDRFVEDAEKTLNPVSSSLREEIQAIFDSTPEGEDSIINDIVDSALISKWSR